MRFTKKNESYRIAVDGRFAVGAHDVLLEDPLQVGPRVALGGAVQRRRPSGRHRGARHVGDLRRHRVHELDRLAGLLHLMHEAIGRLLKNKLFFYGHDRGHPE